MAEALTLGELELNTGAADFVPGERQSQFQSRSRWTRPDFNRNRGGRYAAPHQQRYNRSYCNDEPLRERGCYNRQTYRTWEAPLDSRDGPSARGNHSFQNQRQNRSRNIRTFPTDHSRQLGGSHSESFTEKPDKDGPSWRTEDKKQKDFKNGFGPEDTQDARPKNPRKFTYELRSGPGERGKPALYRDNREDLIEGDRENSLEMVSVEAAKARSNESALKHSHYGNKRAAQGSQRHWQQNKDEHQTRQERSRSTKPQSASSQADRKVNEMVSSGKTREPDSRSSWRSDVERGQGRRMPLQDHGPKKHLSSGRKPFCKKQLDVPKSKETHTGCLIEQLTEEKYECMVCCEVIRVMAPVWSCQSCYHVFHLNCIKKWARSPASQAEDGNEGWRCPACQNVSVRAPNSYTCFCGKVNNPEWNRNEIPHSCGELCCKKRSGLDCNHPCNILCHPGPCPSCPAFVTKACVCGKISQSVRCGQATMIRCTDVCSSLLNCDMHTCAQVCHSGKCQSCQLQVSQVCYCGISSREVPCGTDKEHFDESGHFSCQKLCGKMLDCGKHTCLQVCHPQPCQSCLHLPKVVRSCPCGQTPFSKLLELGYPERKSCTDTIPSCGKTCAKPLPCGSNDSIHLCENLCHEKECGPCSLTPTIKCRCGFKTKELPCAVIQNEADLMFMCDKRCNKKRSCGRHKCNKLCCVDKEHKCSMICGYKLNCGQHRCQELCHRGNCHPCWQTSFDELTCHCGETVIYPPVPCGTRPPECKNPCARKHECDHPVFHNCHSEEKCPPCTYLTQKWCMGKHEQRNNIPCHLADISCGLPCNKQLLCGMHKCRKICHRGDCMTEEQCKQPCCAMKQECGHACSAPCHQGSPCPRAPCTAKVVLQCDCGRKKESMVCSEASTNYQRIAAIAIASRLSDMQLGDSVEIGQLITKKEMKQARLQCDEECAVLERNSLEIHLCAEFMDYSIHLCENLCHEKECGPCSLTPTIKCRCGFKTKELPCAVIQNEADLMFMCDKRCNKKRSCGRHKCNKLCCVDKEHKCSMICGYKLNCGQHRCQELCHRGNCHPCWQTSFDELTCHCGETVIYPPVPCGTRPPECKNPCARKHECDHPVFHNCHSEEKCPPCTYLTQKWCMGKHEQRNNIPCHLADISCGLPCNKQLLCGMHKCRKICHRGDCMTEEQCKQPCCAMKQECGHACSAPCHQGSPCPRAPCTAKVVLQCDCGRKKESMVCSEASTNYQRIAAIAIASRLSDMQLGDSVEIGQLITKKEMKQARLQCDEECAVLERNRRLAEALNIDLSSDPFNTRGSTSKFSDSLKEDARKELKFVSEVEEVMKNLVELANKGKQSKRSHCFPPMNRDHRKIIHELAEVYGIESESYDSEPKRNIIITAVRGKTTCPNTTLTTLIERETATRPPPPIAHHRQHIANSGNCSVMQKAVKEEPVIDYFDVQD